MWPIADFPSVYLLVTTMTHTHTRSTALFPGPHGWAGTRKVKPIWILLKQETVSVSGISWAVCKSAPHSRQITTPAPHHSVFYRPDALPAAQPTASKHWRRMVTTMSSIKITEPIKMPFRIWTRVESGNHVVGGGLDPTSRGKWAIWGTPPAMQAFRQNSLNTCLHCDREFFSQLRWALVCMIWLSQF